MATKNKVNIFQRVQQVVADCQGIEATTIRPDAVFSDDLNVDSIEFMGLVLEFENEFGIDIPDEATGKLLTVQAVVDYVLAN